ncbi:hypothetical protein QVD17_04336 [Tagetes erecta]|uniref:Uncharacterized protein n=1 Tax=Tagetes erecta TaxID=13708 RepID=A0AAD8PAN1_TARER|nr:hypothetical protein QVD17_04336 [Tagetes erecta]
MAATTLFSAPPKLPHHHPISNTPSFISNNKSFLPLSYSSTTNIILRASSSPSTVDEQQQEEEDTNSTADQSQSINSISIGGGCKACGKAEMERGCNGEGRIQGGIATVPGFGWWPIKAYRPCPAFVSIGGRYRRQGQSMDEVAGFGSVPRITTTTTTTTTTPDAQTKSSEKKEGPRKFKR